MNILEIKNVSVFYGNKQILHEINLVVPSKKIVSIVGESGSGKTTLFKTILGIAPRSSGFHFTGEIYLHENQYTPGTNRNIQPVFQDPSLYFHKGWTLQECLWEPVEIFGKDPVEKQKEIVHLLSLFSLDPNLLSQKIETFSGGELQRISIIRTVLTEPELILMDEPVSGLDRLVLGDTIRYIQKLRQEYQISILLISHDLDFVSQISDFLYVMHHGKIGEGGETKNVLQNPQNPYTRELFAARDLSGIFPKKS